MLITTHSDYLIKEINNLVMLSGTFPDKNRLRKRLRYRDEEFLAPASIHAYVAEDRGVTRCAVDRYGVDMPLFDTTIDQINAVSNELSSRIMATGDA